MTSPFARHGVNHLSASSLNLFAAEPALWVMQRLLGKNTPVGSAAHRGTAAEAGINAGLRSPEMPVEDCIALALKEFDKLTALCADGKREEERKSIPEMVRIGLAELRQYGIPDVPPRGPQFKVEINLPGVSVPVIGYKDWHFGAHGVVVDLKTTHKIPAAIPDSHARQGAIYVHGTNHEMRFAYVSGKKCAVYVLEDTARHINAVTQIAQRLERLLALSDDPHKLAGLLVPNYDSFYWNEPITRARGREVFGF